MRGLILSLFPGLDLFGRAFEAAGWCVVRGPDPVGATDIRDWHVPPGRFDGVIGGEPCQCFSRLAHLIRHNGHEPCFGNPIPEFERVTLEARPAWWLMEQVREAPIPVIRSVAPLVEYAMEVFLSDPQSWRRRFAFGQIQRSGLSRPACGLRGRLPLVPLESVEAMSDDQAQYNNGVPRIMGEALANAITEWWEE